MVSSQIEHTKLLSHFKGFPFPFKALGFNCSASCPAGWDAGSPAGVELAVLGSSRNVSELWQVSANSQSLGFCNPFFLWSAMAFGSQAKSSLALLFLNITCVSYSYFPLLQCLLRHSLWLWVLFVPAHIFMCNENSLRNKFRHNLSFLYAFQVHCHCILY